MTYVLFIINVLLVFGACGFILYHNNIVKLCAVSFMTFFAEYVVCSGILFWIDVYSIHRALGLVAIINLAVTVMGYCRHKSMFKLEFDFRSYIIPIIISICAIPFVFAKFEFFGMGQDEGVYQTHAIMLMYGKTDIQQDFEEYDTLSTDEEKEYFKNALEDQLVGLYNYDPDLPFASEDKEISDVSATFHGVPTFASVLALWGKMFGIDHMSDVQTLFYLCTIFFLFFILEELGIKSSVKIVCTALLAFSPLVIWVAKSALTEIQLACYIAAFVYFMIRGDKKSVYWSIVPIAAFSFFHITIYTMIPVILCLYWVGYICTSRKEYIISSFAVITVFLAGMTMIEMIAGTYAFIYNFKPLYHILPFANANNIVYIIWGGCGIACLCGLILLNRYLCEFLMKICKKLRVMGVRLVFVLIVLFQMLLIFNNRDRFNGLFSSLNHSTLVGFVLAAGIFVPIIAGIVVLWKTRVLTNNLTNIFVIILFIYCIGIYSNFMWKYIEYYYYYGRYLVPYVSIVLILSAMAFQNLKDGWGWGIGGLSLVVILPFSLFLVNHKDDTRITWNVIKDLSSVVMSDDVVVINPEDMKYYYLPIRAITCAKIYPAKTDYKTQMSMLTNTIAGSVYVILNGNDFDTSLETIYKNEYMISEDNNLYDGKIIPFPKEFSYRTERVICKRMNLTKLEYNMSTDYDTIISSGIGAVENHFCWTNSEKVNLKCYLNKQKYRLEIKLGGEIPLEALGIEEYPLEIYMNGAFIGSVSINKNNNGKTLDIDMPIDVMLLGENNLMIKSSLWSPSEYGSDDIRHLGIPLECISFFE